MSSSSGMVNMIKNVGKLVITFDDGFETDYTRAYPELRKRGLIGCSYILPSRMPGNGEITWSHARIMDNGGHDMECHGYTHTARTELTEEELEQEMIDVNNAFDINNISTPSHHAFPFGSYQSNKETILDIMGQYRTTLRTTSGGQTNPVNTKETYESEGVLYAKTADIVDENYFNEVKEYIDYIENNVIVGIIYIHEIVDIPADYKCLFSYYTNLLDYILTKNIEVISINQVIDALNLLD